MPIRVDAYITGGMASGVLPRAGHLRDVLESEPTLDLERTTWHGVGESAPRPMGELSIPIDDVLVAVADDDPTIPVHASWHDVAIEIGPYRLEGLLPTLPGYDPGRALTRPAGEFVMLRDVRMGLRDDTRAGVAIGAHALVNRYGVERITAEIMLGFYFPGATMDGLPASETLHGTGSPATGAPATPAGTSVAVRPAGATA